MSKEARLGGRLRRLRQERKLSQATMAEQLGISASYLNLLEHNQRPVTVPVLLKLAQRFAIEVVIRPAGQMDATLREYNPITRQLFLSELLPPSSRTFQLAYQIGNLGWRREIDLLASPGKFTSQAADKLARSALANYFAAAVLMPYERFLEAARRTRYDVEILQLRFSASFEQVCHRLTTLRRAGAE